MKVNVTDEAPPELVAVIVTLALGYAVVGVPLTKPLFESNTTPEGRIPALTPYDVGAPPLTLGVIDEIPIPL